MKERFQIFSMIYRLSKDFTFIKPIETIVLRLLESSLKHCITEIKKSGKFNIYEFKILSGFYILLNLKS